MTDQYITIPIYEWLHSLGYLASRAFRDRNRRLIGPEILREDSGDAPDEPLPSESAFAATGLLSLIALVEAFEARMRYRIWNQNLDCVVDQYLDKFNNDADLAERSFYHENRKETFGRFGDSELITVEIEEVLVARNAIAHAHVWTYNRDSENRNFRPGRHLAGHRNQKFVEHVSLDTAKTKYLQLPVTMNLFRFDDLSIACGAVNRYLTVWCELDVDIDKLICQKLSAFNGPACLDRTETRTVNHDNLLEAISSA